MSKKLIIKTVLLSVGSMVVVACIYFYVMFQINMYKTINQVAGGMAQTVDFVNKEFPEQVKDYVSKSQTQAQAPVAPVATPEVKK